MRQASARAAASPARGGLPNALFVWAAVEQLPAELTGVTEVHAVMPWGSLLRTTLGRDPAALRRLAAACRPDTPLQVALNLHAWRPPVREVADLPEPDPTTAVAQLAGRYAEGGWRVEKARYLTGPDVDALQSSWARRLGSTRDRLDVLSLTATRDG